MKLNILKCHGSENTFLLIDEVHLSHGFSDEQRSSLAARLCNRTDEFSADGVLYIQDSEVADARMRIFNADGTEPEMCGNGARCAGRYVLELLGETQISLETMKAVLQIQRGENLAEGVESFIVEIGPLSFTSPTIPSKEAGKAFMNEHIPELDRELRFSALTLPNPHVIAFMDMIDTEYLKELGKKANHLEEVFPEGVNVSFAKKINQTAIYVSTYERGVGLTSSCGTAMTASSLVHCFTNFDEVGDIDEKIKVHNSGGFVYGHIKKTGDSYNLRLQGNATYMFDGLIELNLSSPNSFIVLDMDWYREEMNVYERFRKQNIS